MAIVAWQLGDPLAIVNNLASTLHFDEQAAVTCIVEPSEIKMAAVDEV